MLFASFLKPVAVCDNCGQDWTRQRADDFPAYISIFITGHLMAPVVIVLAGNTELSGAVLSGMIITLAAVLTIGLLQPAKGAVIALQWWFGMHGFNRESPEMPGLVEETRRAGLAGRSQTDPLISGKRVKKS